MNDVYKKIFLYGINLSYILYFIVLFGVTGYAPEYLNYLRNFLKVYIAVLLIVLYNPYIFRKKSEFGEFDRKLVFSSGIFLLLSTTLIGGIEEYFRQQGAKIMRNII